MAVRADNTSEPSEVLLCAPGAAWSEFLEVLEAAPAAESDLLITEVTMAEISGVDLAIRVKEQCPTSRHCSRKKR